MEKGVKPFEFKECVIVPRSTGNPGRQFIVFSQNHDQVGNRLARIGASTYRNIFTGKVVSASERNGRRALSVGEVFAHFPVALLGSVD